MDTEWSFDETDTSFTSGYCESDPEFMTPLGTKSGVEYLSNVDYSLNSPLIADELEEFLKFWSGEPHRKSWNITTWVDRRRAFELLKSHPRDIIKPGHFHEWFGRKNNIDQIDTSLIRSLLDKTQKDADETIDVVKAFIKGWLNKTIPNPKKNRCPQQILKWGAFFLDLHLSTLLLNALHDEEVNELLKIPGVNRLSQDCKTSYVYHSLNFGRIIISLGFALFVDENVLMDRNTLLMCKDTYVARFQTLLCMINRVDDTFLSEDWRIINEIYLRGDRLLHQHGNAAYDCIKLIEPVCSLQMSRLAHRYRDKIPEFTEFRDHIDTSINDLSDRGFYVQRWFDLIFEMENPDLVLTVFGSFRHWGHPYLSYLDGLRSVHEQVTMKKDIDGTYANILASDLAYIVLSTKFSETKRWYVDLEKLDRTHILYKHVKTNTWPTPKQIKDFGHRWHNLPLLPCFDIPDVIDPSLIYSDKSHSMNKSDVLNHIKWHPSKPIPSKKVLETFLNSPATNWKLFLREIDTNGLTTEDLVIGLRGKEREVKIKGRFFSLMSWRLREYFVVTEYLIKMFYVPLFKGLTMADDLNTVIKKLMDNSNGQGTLDYENICIANHIDYTKWNNHQRHEANGPVFRVMGRFLGYPNLISRTHEFFQKSLIYYNARPDLMGVQDGQVYNKTANIVCWEGQDGGLEGLRQKGWSVVNLLVIRRESINCNTKVKILAQGDNQVICTQYKLQKCRDERDLERALQNIVKNNKSIMDAIERGTKKLGLIINKDETLQSADYLIYGKVPIYRGNIKGIESKRWARVTCVTNDQLPTLSNTLSTVNSNALTVAHFSSSPLNSMVHYNFLGNFARNLIELHDPALRRSHYTDKSLNRAIQKKEYKVMVLYLDPCLGGSCGMSLTRYLIRGFPDPLTESLAFWKVIHSYGKGWLQKIAVRAGNPKLGKPNLLAFKKLMEDPLSINIPGGVNPLTLIKEEIKKNLIQNSSKIQNEIVRSSLNYMEAEEDRIISYLKSIDPLFPRFLSEYLSGTYIGIIRSLVGLFQNSKTIRNVFSRRMDRHLRDLVIKSEFQTIQRLSLLCTQSCLNRIWSCSSTRADQLRFLSWGRTVYGATVPHPIELIGRLHDQSTHCMACEDAPPRSYYLSTFVPSGLNRYSDLRGPYKAYLGSRTSESTSILQPWEKETKVPLLRRAVKLRDSIGWFVDKDSKLADGLLNNLYALTGEEWDRQTEGFKRTGSALHRFTCSRQSNSGYSAQSPAKLTWMCSTTDTMSALNDVNHDFMHQTLLIYSQATVSELMDGNPKQGYYHSHMTCLECLREIEDIELDTQMDFEHKEVYESLSKWKPQNTPWATRRQVQDLQKGDWSLLSKIRQSYHIGRAEGFIYGDLILSRNSRSEEGSLFPLSIQHKVNAQHYLEGLLNGLLRASGIHCISRRAISELRRPREAILGVGLYLIDKVSDNTNMLGLWRSANFESLFFRTPHKVPKSYPLSNHDLGMLGRDYLRATYKRDYMGGGSLTKDVDQVWVFSDMNESSLVALYSLSGIILATLYSNNMSRSTKTKIRGLKTSIVTFKDPNQTSQFRIPNYRSVFRIDSELRHACKTMNPEELMLERFNPEWGNEYVVDVYSAPVEFTSTLTEQNAMFPELVRIQNPLISGLRLFQFATGSHYKILSILTHFGLRYTDTLVGGDGSGGIGALLLRLNPHSHLIFNSLLCLDKVDLRGSTPSPPSAIFSLGIPRERCINLYDAWEHPNDLSLEDTWFYFMSLRDKHQLHLDLIILDPEIQDLEIVRKVELNISIFVHELLEEDGTLIYKTYLDRLIQSTDFFFLKEVATQFCEVYISNTELTSSQSLEVYLICRGRRLSPINLFPQIDSVSNFVSLSGVSQDIETDFKRALKVSQMDLLSGVPELFVSDPFCDSAELLEALGVETGIAALATEMIRANLPNNRSDVIFAYFFICFNSLLGLTALCTKPPPPKSDSRVYHIGIFVCGVFNWLSISYQDSHLHTIAQRYIRDHFLFSWECQSIKIKSSSQNENKTRTLYRNHYSFTGKYHNTKNFFLDSKMDMIGQLIRCFVRMLGPEQVKPKQENVDKIMSRFNKSLTLQKIGEVTDLISLLKQNCDLNMGEISDGNPQENVSDLGEASYVS